MGIKILPMEPGDEDRYDIITITSPKKWRPHRFQCDEPTNPPHDPADVAVNKLVTNHDTINKNVKTSICTMSINQPLVDTQVLAISTMHKVIYKDTDPTQLRQYLGWRPTIV